MFWNKLFLHLRITMLELIIGLNWGGFVIYKDLSFYI